MLLIGAFWHIEFTIDPPHYLLLLASWRWRRVIVLQEGRGTKQMIRSHIDNVQENSAQFVQMMQLCGWYNRRCRQIGGCVLMGICRWYSWCVHGAVWLAKGWEEMVPPWLMDEQNELNCVVTMVHHRHNQPHPTPETRLPHLRRYCLEHSRGSICVPVTFQQSYSCFLGWHEITMFFYGWLFEAFLLLFVVLVFFVFVVIGAAGGRTAFHSRWDVSHCFIVVKKMKIGLGWLEDWRTMWEKDGLGMDSLVCWFVWGSFVRRDGLWTKLTECVVNWLLHGLNRCWMDQ